MYPLTDVLQLQNTPFLQICRIVSVYRLYFDKFAIAPYHLLGFTSTASHFMDIYFTPKWVCCPHALFLHFPFIYASLSCVADCGDKTASVSVLLLGSGEGRTLRRRRASIQA